METMRLVTFLVHNEVENQVTVKSIVSVYWKEAMNQQYKN